MRKIDTIEEMQKKELEMMKELHKVLEDNGLRYFLAYGTLLGAVRHRGFIPWDDDIDIMMPRPDFEKLRRKADILLSNTNLKLAFYDRNDVFYPRPFAKIIDTRTSLVESEYEDKHEIGVFIDIFVLDGLPKGKLTRLLFKKECLFLKKLYFASIVDPKRFSGLKSRMLSKIAHHMDRNKLLSRIDRVCQKYKYDTCNEVINLFSPQDLAMDRNKISLRLSKFEDMDFYIPENSEEILKSRYGNYLKLPPKEEQVRRHPASVYWK